MRKLIALIFLMMLATYANSKSSMGQYQFKSFENITLFNCGQKVGLCIPES